MNIYVDELKQENINTALSLVWRVFLKYEAPEYTQEGIDEFYKSIHSDEYLSQLCIYGAYENDHLIGIIATRNSGTHIALFFVDENYHKQGVGKKLLQVAVQNCKAEKMTVNSSPYAVPVYHKLGFCDSEKEQTVNGLRFIPMVYDII